MRKTAPPFKKTPHDETASLSSHSDALARLRPHALPSSSLSPLIESWLLAGDINRHSARTLESRRERVFRLVWFLDQRGYGTCGRNELRQFFHYVAHGHEEPGGRWGNPRLSKPTSSGRAKAFHSSLRAFFGWLVAEGELEVSPMERITAPVDRPDQVQPFSDDQLRALLVAARRPRRTPSERRGSALRDEAIVLLLLDTGIRATELCSLTCDDVDLQAALVQVREGKGGKGRTVPFSRDTKRALYKYLNERDADERDAPLFLSERGNKAGDELTRSGLLQLIRRLGKVAGIEGARCSPHTFRHSFAVGFLRAGGNVFTLRQMLGHESLHMTNRYVAIAQADIRNQHRAFSPVARLKEGKNR